MGVIKRSSQDFKSVKNVVQKYFDDVKQRGDEALKTYAKQLDKIELDVLLLTMKNAYGSNYCDDLKNAIRLAGVRGYS